MRRLINVLSHFPVRLALYALIGGLLLHGIVLMVTSGRAAVFAEDGPIEWLHAGLMLGAGGLFLRLWYVDNVYPLTLLLCCMLSIVAALRELDHYSEVVLFEDAYKYPVALIAFFALYVLGKHRSRLGRDIGAFTKEPAFFFLAFGSFLTAIVAQILGQVELWQALVVGSSPRTPKRVVEESLETMGYAILFLGAVEACIHLRSRKSPDRPARR